jgi:hypothetical protein
MPCDGISVGRGVHAAGLSAVPSTSNLISTLSVRSLFASETACLRPSGSSSARIVAHSTQDGTESARAGTSDAQRPLIGYDRPVVLDLRPHEDFATDNGAGGSHDPHCDKVLRALQTGRTAGGPGAARDVSDGPGADHHARKNCHGRK